MVLGLLREDGSGADYVDPGPEAKKKKAAKQAFGLSDRYIQLPAAFWTDGWAARLSARAVAVLLALHDVVGGKEWGWVSLSERERYGLSEDTWIKGVAELKEHGLIQVRRRSVGEDFDFRRVRNTYKLNRDQEGTLKLPARPKHLR